MLGSGRPTTGYPPNPTQHWTTTGNTGFDEGSILGWTTLKKPGRLRCVERDADIAVAAVTQESKPVGPHASGTPLLGALHC